MIYAYACGTCGALIDREFPMRGASNEVTCPCGREAYRDFSTIRQLNDDPIRAAILSDKIEWNLQEQQRGLMPGTPRDKFDARHMEREHGRVYIGDDYSHLKPAARKAIEKKEWLA